jgi:hypothetical protein
MIIEKLKINTIYNSKLDRVLNYCGAEYDVTPKLVEYGMELLYL